jgi:hypothetical protein
VTLRAEALLSNPLTTVSAVKEAPHFESKPKRSLMVASYSCRESLRSILPPGFTSEQVVIAASQFFACVTRDTKTSRVFHSGPWKGMSAPPVWPLECRPEGLRSRA